MRTCGPNFFFGAENHRRTASSAAAAFVLKDRHVDIENIATRTDNEVERMNRLQAAIFEDGIGERAADKEQQPDRAGGKAASYPPRRAIVQAEEQHREAPHRERQRDHQPHQYRDRVFSAFSRIRHARLFIRWSRRFQTIERRNLIQRGRTSLAETIPLRNLLEATLKRATNSREIARIGEQIRRRIDTSNRTTLEDYLRHRMPEIKRKLRSLLDGVNGFAADDFIDVGGGELQRAHAA